MLKKYALNDEHEKRLERDGEDSGNCEDVFFVNTSFNGFPNSLCRYIPVGAHVIKV